MYGLGGGGLGDHIFAVIRAEVGHFQDFGLFVQNTQVANWGLLRFVHCFVISWSYKETPRFSKSAHQDASIYPVAFFPNETICSRN